MTKPDRALPVLPVLKDEWRSSSKKRFTAPRPDTQNIPRLLVVSGVSGVGKSKFIEQLRAHEIDAQLRALLPALCEVCVEKEGIDFTGIDVETFLSSDDVRQGLILHYEISDVHRMGINCYERDPALRLLLRADEVCVLILRVPQAQLIQQFEGRIRQRAQHRGRWRELWRRHVKQRMQSVGARFKDDRTVPHLEIYGDHARLERCYASWLAYVGALAEQHPGMTVVAARPDVMRNGDAHDFRFIVTKAAL